MDNQARANRMWIGVIVAGVLAITAFGPAGSTSAQEAKAAKEPPKPLRSSPAEPMAPAASMELAAVYLDRVSVSWTRQHKCGSCHTNYPYLLARPVLKAPASSAMTEVRQFFEQRVAHWDDKEKGAKPKWDAEVVSTATALAANDAATTGKLDPRTRAALDRIWTVQKADGGFDWLKCGWPPFEDDDYYGALVAAIGVGHAPDGYARSPSAQVGLERLRAYFAKNPAPNLHHQTWLLWASTRLGDLMTAETRSITIRRLRERQRGTAAGTFHRLAAGSGATELSTTPRHPATATRRAW